MSGGMAQGIKKKAILSCPWRIGQHVIVKQSHKYARQFRGIWVITGLRLEYKRRKGSINVTVAREDDIRRGYAGTDGWSVDTFDLPPDEE